jgi:hypothetical protein
MTEMGDGLPAQRGLALGAGGPRNPCWLYPVLTVRRVDVVFAKVDFAAREMFRGRGLVYRAYRLVTCIVGHLSSSPSFLHRRL